jgi:MFS family permease
MYRSASAKDEIPTPRPTAVTKTEVNSWSKPARSAYGSSFWFAYLANTSLMVAVSLLFRYGDFISIAGGTEFTLGWVVGVGTIGSLLMRLFQGVGIDRYGPRRIWLLSLVMVSITLLSHLAITTAQGPAIYILRVVYHTSLAGAFGASITYISLRAPVARTAEIIGMLGSSGFVGMALGTQLGDILCHAQPLQRMHIDRLFIVATSLVLLSLLFAWRSTRGELRPIRRKRPPMWWLLRRYHPGTLLLIAVAMGMGLGIPGTFLRPYTESLGITTIGTFFGIYSITAFMTRVATRRVPDRIGIRPTILIGMGALVTSMVCYLFVQSTWQLVLPGVIVGIAHALLFPAVVGGGSQSFPARYRGLGTTLVLGMFDLGCLIGMPLAGSVIHLAPRAGLPAYPSMFLTIATLLVLASTVFALRPARHVATALRAAAQARPTTTPPQPEQPALLVSCGADSKLPE